MAEEETTPVEEVVEPTPPTNEGEEVTPVEPAPAEEEQVTEEEEAPEAPEGEEEPPKEPSRREQLRIQNVIAKARRGDYAPKADKPQMDYEQALNADPETVKALEADRRAAVEAVRSDSVKQAESIHFRTLLEIDTPRVIGKYGILDPQNKEVFNPAAADAINSWFLATAGWDNETGFVQNSNVRYADFVEGIMELADELAGNKVATTTKNITRQAAQTGIRPDGSQAKRLNLDKDPAQMTDEELKAAIGRSGLKA